MTPGAEGSSRNNLLIRDARDEDMAPVQGVYRHYVLNGLATFEETPPSAGDMASRRAAVLAAGLPYLVAEAADGRVVGYCYAASFHPRSAYRYAIENSVYVADDMRGRGVGAALLQALIGRCETGPWRQMIAIIGDSGNAGSIALHRKLGFQHVGVFRSVGFKLGQWVDTVMMQRALGPGDTTAPF